MALALSRSRQHKIRKQPIPAVLDNTKYALVSISKLWWNWWTSTNNFFNQHQVHALVLNQLCDTQFGIQHPTGNTDTGSSVSASNTDTELSHDRKHPWPADFLEKNVIRIGAPQQKNVDMEMGVEINTNNSNTNPFNKRTSFFSTESTRHTPQALNTYFEVKYVPGT